MTRPPLHLIVLAGGSGERARRRRAQPPKQFQNVGGRLLVLWSAAGLAAADGVASVTIACAEPWRVVLADALAVSPLPVPVHLAAAGATRTASTWCALRELAGAVAPSDDELVAVHDAARPFASAALLERLAAAAARHGGAVPGVPVADTIVVTGDDDGVGYLRRDHLRAVQTPQVFRWRLLYDAHAWAAEAGCDFTDDGGLLAARGTPPVLVEGEAGNWKITTADDLTRARQLLRRRRP